MSGDEAEPASPFDARRAAARAPASPRRRRLVALACVVVLVAAGIPAAWVVYYRIDAADFPARASIESPDGTALPEGRASFSVVLRPVGDAPRGGVQYAAQWARNSTGKTGELQIVRDMNVIDRISVSVVLRRWIDADPLRFARAVYRPDPRVPGEFDLVRSGFTRRQSDAAATAPGGR